MLTAAMSAQEPLLAAAQRVHAIGLTSRAVQRGEQQPLGRGVGHALRSLREHGLPSR